MMKILHTESSCGWGGQELRILTESAALQARGHQITLVAPLQSQIHERAHAYGVQSIPLAIEKKRWTGLQDLRQHLTNHQYDVINTHSSTDSWLVSLTQLALNKPCPIVRTRHVSAPVRSSWPNRWLYGRSVRKIVTTGEIIREHLIHTLSLPPEHVISIPTGIDINLFRPVETDDKKILRSQLALPNEVTLIGIAATLRSWKGHSYLIEAIAKVSDPSLQLIVIGDGPQMNNLRELTARLNLNNKVKFVGHQSNVHEWLQAIDIFCLPSYANEGVPQALIQAMLSSLPCITTTAGAIPELARDQETALIVPMRESDSLANAIQQLTTNPQLCEKLGHQARTLCTTAFSLSHMADKMEAVFEEAIHSFK
jgi:glycosyltransferase involved in cell wall biosynthesis